MLGTAGASLGKWARKVEASDGDAALIVNQKGTGLILDLQDGEATVFSVADGGNVTLASGMTVGGSINMAGAGTLYGVLEVSGNDANGARLIGNEGAENDVPTLIPTRADETTGIGGTTTSVSTIVGTNEQMRVTANDVSLFNNTLSNVGASGNDWGARSLEVENTGTVYIKAESTDGVANIYCDSYSSPWGGFVLQENSVARYYLLYSTSGNYFSIRSFDTDGSQTEADVVRIPDGQLTIDSDATWDDNVAFDAYDDAMVLSRAFSADSNILKDRQSELIDMGVLRLYDDGWVGYSDKRMAALLAGGIYQNRERIDAQYEAIDERLKRIEQALGV